MTPQALNELVALQRRRREPNQWESPAQGFSEGLQRGFRPAKKRKQQADQTTSGTVVENAVPQTSQTSADVASSTPASSESGGFIDSAVSLGKDALSWLAPTSLGGWGALLAAGGLTALAARKLLKK